MKSLVALLLAVTVPLLSGGCSRGGAIGSTTLEATPGSPVQYRLDPVVDTGRPAAVLSLHSKLETLQGCGYGLTLTNNLEFEIKRMEIRFAAYGHKDVLLDEATANFFGVRPTSGQYVEINFPFTCDRIGYLLMIDPGRCTMGELEERSAQPGQCLAYVDVPANPYVRLRVE
jgi:hypothetical protein